MGKFRRSRRRRRGNHPSSESTVSAEELPLEFTGKPVPLYIADDFEGLTTLVKSDVIKGLKKIDRLPTVAHRMLHDLSQIQNDQERIYIIGKRYLKVMDRLFKHTEDKTFVEIRYGSEYRHVEHLINDVEDELKARYASMATLKEEEKKRKEAAEAEPEMAAGSVDSERVYIQPAEKPLECVTKPDVNAEPVFPASEIGPVELFNALMKKENMLIVDTRPAEEFKDSHIIIEDGHLINIPGETVVAGLSANTLGQRLNPETQPIWERRDSFSVIVLIDWDTDAFNCSGSKVERLRNCIVEWDFNRVYRQEPVILNGGFKEFLEWYPSEVTNSQAYLSQTNSDIDELLTIDEVSYPEAGSAAGNMNLKVHTVSSFGDVQARVQRDFGDMEVSLGPAARPSRSEGQLPIDFYSSQKGKSPYRSLSEESLPRDYLATEPMIEPLPLLEPLPAPETLSEIDTEEKSEVPESDKLAQIKSAIESDRAELLKEARALKPKVDTPRSDPKEVIKRNLIEENKDLFVPPNAPPTVDRTFKPARVQQPPPVLGEGYTGIRNLRNNCYVSAIMQGLKVLPVMKSMFVTSNMYMKHIHKVSPAIILHFASFIKTLWEGSHRRSKTYYPQNFLERIYDLNPAYAKGNHEDAFEFFIFLFNHLSEDCSVDLPRPKTEREKSWYSQLQGRSSVFNDLIYYQLKNTRVCWNCQKPSYIFDNDSALMLHVPEKKEQGNLEYLIKEYLKENLVPDYSCADCKSSATIVNRKEIVLDPEILIIVLKRYKANPDGTFRKNEAEISFPMDNLQFGKSLYKLFAIPQHTGTMSVGHYYTSALLNEAKNTWVLFNDDRVTRYSCSITEVPGIRTSCVGFFYVRYAQKKSEC